MTTRRLKSRLTTTLLVTLAALAATGTLTSCAADEPPSVDSSAPAIAPKAETAESSLLEELAPGDVVEGFYAAPRAPVTAVMPAEMYEKFQTSGIRELGTRDGRMVAHYGVLDRVWGRGSTGVDVGSDATAVVTAIRSRTDLRDVVARPVEVGGLPATEVTFANRTNPREVFNGEGSDSRVLWCFAASRACLAPDDRTSRAYLVPQDDDVVLFLFDSPDGSPLDERAIQRLMRTVRFR